MVKTLSTFIMAFFPHLREGILQDRYHTCVNLIWYLLFKKEKRTIMYHFSGLQCWGEVNRGN